MYHIEKYYPFKCQFDEFDIAKHQTKEVNEEDIFSYQTSSSLENISTGGKLQLLNLDMIHKSIDNSSLGFHSKKETQLKKIQKRFTGLCLYKSKSGIGTNARV